MRPVHYHIALTLVAGAALGLFGGNATIAGMASPAVSDLTYDSAPVASDAVDGYAAHADADTVSARLTHIAAACGACSDYDLGYRFAAARHVRDSGQCMDFTWSYQRGCRAWLREN